MQKIILAIIFTFQWIGLNAQSISNQFLTSNSDTVFDIINHQALDSFYTSLQKCSTSKPVHVVIIGDSHIQGGILTDTLRTLFQKKFGNAGRGLVFPYNLIGTNGSNELKGYGLNPINHYSVLDCKKNHTLTTGICGYTIGSKDSNTVIYIKPSFAYDSILIFGSEDIVYERTILNSVESKKTIQIKIKKNDNLNRLAKRLKMNKKELIRLNPKLKKIKLIYGKYLRITVTEKRLSQDIKNKKDSVISLRMNKTSVLNGIEFINSVSGIRVSGIGTNGAKLSDFNQQNNFFEELNKLKPDLIILAFGTNESYAQMC